MTGLLERARTQLIVIDVQDRLLPVMSDPVGVLARCELLVQAAARLGAPVTVSQQYPRGVGATAPSLRAHLPAEAAILDKMTFSCWRDEGLRDRIGGLARAGRDQALVCGIEAHVCVLQTTLDLLAEGLPCFVAADATGSRAPLSHQAALQRMAGAGAACVTAEMAVFEWLGAAGTPDFKALLPLIK